MAGPQGEKSSGGYTVGFRINLGSGQRPFQKPWVNVDKHARWNPDILHDLGNPLDKKVFEDNSADIIVLSHVLEHFGCGEADGLLKECYRILEPRGSLLVFVPDLWKLTALWREGKMTTQVFLTNVYGAYNGAEEDRHKWGFRTDTLMKTLWNAGFVRVTYFDWRVIPGADIARDDTWILGMEAVK
jgi:SAM-dependent methyltransferase